MKWRMRFVFVALLVSIFVAPYVYDARGKFAFGFAGILICLYFLFRKRAVALSGLMVSRKQLFVASLIFAAFASFSHWLIHSASSRFGLTAVPYDQLDWRLSPIFQVLNEEIVTRALLLGFVAKFIPYRLIVSIFAAAIFTALHYLLYRFNLHSSVSLFPLTLLNLFLFGVLCNSLFLKWRHIWFCYAIHLGWNLSRFTRDFVKGETPIPEGMTFNIFEGQIWLTAVLIFGVLSTFSLWYSTEITTEQIRSSEVG